ncbi:hypothetical protein M413DRAFT_25458 [Hebeloma cylindrosporum]|uniref:Uncharacterized protein n=1 Tax=Hebeloma cylindrosporum TaxID=76867 RepID=A0A0C2YSD0_HEBCY|nr:hypothetical protein M413DRAFT_25458 [Hebeloma cylindrosporum h7]
MVQIANTLIIATAVVVPVLSAPLGLDSNPLEAREPKGFRTAAKIAGKVAGGVSLGATVGGIMQQRDLKNYLSAREPRGVKTALNIAGKVAGGVSLGATVGGIMHQRDLKNYLSAREPRGVRTAVNIAGKVASGVSLGATVGGIMHQRDLERREPRITVTSGQIAAAGRIAHNVKSGVEFGSAVAPMLPHRSKRDFEELDARRISGATLRTIGGGVAGAAGFAGTVAAMNTRPQRRDLDNSEFLEARRISGAAIRKVGSGLAGAAGFAGTVAALNTRPQQRELEFEAREPEFSADLILRDDNGDIYVRDFDGLDPELVAREPKFFGLLKKAAGLVLRETPLKRRQYIESVYLLQKQFKQVFEILPT